MAKHTFLPLLSILHTLHHSTPLQLSRKTSCRLENYIKNKKQTLKHLCQSQIEISLPKNLVSCGLPTQSKTQKSNCKGRLIKLVFSEPTIRINALKMLLMDSRSQKLGMRYVRCWDHSRRQTRALHSLVGKTLPLKFWVTSALMSRQPREIKGNTATMRVREGFA